MKAIISTKKFQYSLLISIFYYILDVLYFVADNGRGTYLNTELQFFLLDYLAILMIGHILIGLYAASSYRDHSWIIKNLPFHFKSGLNERIVKSNSQMAMIIWSFIPLLNVYVFYMAGIKLANYMEE